MRRAPRYNGVSLVEMLITIVIMTTVMLLAAVTLNTLIKVSSVSNGRAMARDESEFAVELIRRNVKNSHADDVYIYNVTGRVFDEALGKVVDEAGVNGYDTPVAEGTVGSEIHFRPIGYHRWICIGYFPKRNDSTVGYIVKSSYTDNLTPQSCLDGTSQQYAQNALVLNSGDVYAQQLDFQMFKTASNNLRVVVNVKMKPRVILLLGNRITPEFFRQALISSEKLDWE